MERAKLQKAQEEKYWKAKADSVRILNLPLQEHFIKLYPQIRKYLEVYDPVTKTMKRLPRGIV
jgi:hypothetical protein